VLDRNSRQALLFVDPSIGSESGDVLFSQFLQLLFTILGALLFVIRPAFRWPDNRQNNNAKERK
jgi:hypothetical protein